MARRSESPPGKAAEAVAARSISTASLADGAVTAAKVGGVLYSEHIPGLDASKLVSGTVADVRLSPNVALLNRSLQTFTGPNIFSDRVGMGTAASASTLRLQGVGSLGDIWLSPTTSGGNADIFLSENTSGSFGIILRHNGTDNTLDFVAVNNSVETTEPVVSMGPWEHQRDACSQPCHRWWQSGHRHYQPLAASPRQRQHPRNRHHHAQFGPLS